MIVHVLTQILGILSCLIGAWLLSSILESVERGNKADKFMVFWTFYSLVTGIFLIITG